MQAVKSLPCIGLIPDVFPEVQKSPQAMDSQTGASTRNAVSRTGGKKNVAPLTFRVSEAWTTRKHSSPQKQTDNSPG